MLSTIEGRGKKIAFDEGATERKLNREFGEPIHVEQFHPPKLINQLQLFKGHFTESGQRLDYSDSLKPDMPVFKLHIYRYVGRTAIDQSQMAGMELAFGIMSLGITEILLIPAMMESLSDDSRDDEITDFAVAFDRDGKSLARTFIPRISPEK